jgi:deoxyribodipyrimidine photo-lyase
VPELRAIDGGAVHEPGLLRPDSYPPQMVDHGIEREEALARYKLATAGSR